MGSAHLRTLCVLVSTFAMIATSVMVLTPSVATADNVAMDWSLPSQVSPAIPTNAIHPDVAWEVTDRGGSAMAVWLQTDLFGTLRPWSSRLDRDYGWQMAEPIPDTGGGVQVSSLTGDDCIRVISPAPGWFFVYYTMFQHIHANYWNMWHGWSGYAQQEDVGSPTAIACNIDAATDGNGKIVISWVEYSPAQSEAYMKVFDLADWSGWGPVGEEHLDFSPGDPYDVDAWSGVSVAIGSNGMVTAVWSQTNTVRYGIYSNRLEGGVLQGVQTVDSGLDNDARYPEVAMNANNDAVCVWRHEVGGIMSIYAALREDGSGPDWATSDQIEASDGHAGPPEVSMNRAGSALAVWAQVKGSGYWGVYANVFDLSFSTGFNKNAAQLVSDEGNWLTSVSDIQVCLDFDGNADVVWVQSESGWRYHLLARSYHHVLGWNGGISFIENFNCGDVDEPAVASHWGEAGRYVVVWEYQNPLDTTYLQIMGCEHRGWGGLWVQTPVEGTTTAIPVVEVYGWAYPDTMVTVNGFMVSLDQYDQFLVKIPLLEGANTITVIGTTSTGASIGWPAITVTYNNPIPGMLADIAQLLSDTSTLNGEVSAIQADVAALQTDVGALQTDVDALQADVVAAEGQLTALLADVNALESSLAAAQAEIDAVSGNVTTAQGAITALQADLTATKAQVTAVHNLVKDAWADLNSTKANLDTTEDALTTTQGDVSDLPSKMFVMAGLIVVAVVLAALLALMYVSLKKSISKIGK